MATTTELQQRLKQKISPKQIQYWQLLSYSEADLASKISKEVEENIVLVEKQNEENQEEYKNQSNAINPYFFEKRNAKEYILKNSHSLKSLKPWREKLVDQLCLLKLTPTIQKIGEHLIGSLDESGYLRKDLTIIASEMAVLYYVEVEVKAIEKALGYVQQLEPTGVGARNLSEALLLQLKKKKATPSIAKAIDIITNYFTPFTKRDYQTIIKKTNLTPLLLAEALAEIKKLYPAPILNDDQETTSIILEADFQVRKINNQIMVKLPKNRAASLHVHNEYQRLIQAYQEAREQEKKRAMQFINRSIQRAEHFIEALKQRYKTLSLVMKTIVKMQQNFFEEEDEKNLLPMSLQDIGDAINMDESTISRAINGKFVETDSKIYSLKFFFSEGIPTENGAIVSSKKVKKVLAETIEGENKQQPYSDEKLTVIMQEQGYLIARRTIAKYRQQLGIASSRLRRELYID